MSGRQIAVSRTPECLTGVMKRSSPTVIGPITASALLLLLVFATLMPFSIGTELPSVGASYGYAGVFLRTPEGAVPDGIKVSRRERAGSLQRHPAGAEASAALQRHVATHWGDLTTLDVVSLSRWHAELTRGWQVPPQPTFSDAELLAATPDALYLMQRGPRLPAPFDAVHRYLVFFARYDLGTGEIRNVAVSIHGEVFER